MFTTILIVVVILIYLVGVPIVAGCRHTEVFNTVDGVFWPLWIPLYFIYKFIGVPLYNLGKRISTMQIWK